MKTKELIKRLFVTNEVSESKRNAALHKLLKKLRKKEEKLRDKLKIEESEDEVRRLEEKLQVNQMHQNKAQELLEVLEA